MRVTKNIFGKGRNTDQDPNIIEPTQYSDAHNVELVGDGAFFGLKNIRGTTKIEDIIDVAGTQILGDVETKYLIGGTQVNCITIFTAAPSGNFKIWCYDIENSTLYEIYEEATPADYFDSDERIVSAEVYAENGVDIVYYTDFYNEIRNFRCEIPDPYSPNFLTEFDLSLQRRGAVGSITLDSIVATGGSLLSGTYQFAYRMIDPTNKRFTKWSVLTGPIHVYDKANDNGKVFSGIGLPTTCRIVLDVVPSQTELDNYDHFQLAVIENIYPTGAGTVVAGENTTFVASLLPIESTDNRLNYSYSANTRVGQIPISDIVVDLAPIQTVKSLRADRGRLFGLNVKYRPLEFDNGVPQITSGTIRRETVISNQYDIYSDHLVSSLIRGYFRDEVYRFAIVYYDKYGNASAPKVLDLSNVTDNQISGGLIDMKFPSRGLNNNYSIFSNAGANRLQSLGLQLNGIVNHPTWAVAFEIVRAKRIKNILFQTPVVLMTDVVGIGAMDDYPTTATISGPTTRDQPDATPQTTTKTYVPKNLFWPELRHIVRRTTTTVAPGLGSSGNTLAKQGEVAYSTLGRYSQHVMVFPPQNMYGDGVINFSGAETLTIIDYCIMKANIQDFNTDIVAGTALATNVAGNFYALRDGDYFFDSGWTGKLVDTSPASIVDNVYLDNLASPVTLGGESIMNYDGLQTGNVEWGRKPNIQRSMILKLDKNILDMSASSREFTNGTINAFSDLSTVAVNFIAGEGVNYELAKSRTNKYIHKYSGWTSDKYSQALHIANVTLGRGDNRYGDVDTPHEFIRTGAFYTFTPSELIDVQAANPVPVNISVFGGDCFIGPHTFKVADSAYSIVNQGKNNTPSAPESLSAAITAWEQVYRNSASAILCQPVPVNGAAQYIQVILESEYNGEVMDRDHLTSAWNVNGIPVSQIDSEGSVRSPLTYNYNINLSKQNDQKIFLPKPQFTFEQNDFQSRIVFSDPKIYNSSERGFDIYRVLNFYDLEESGGRGVKLVKSGDYLFAIQDNRITYLPTGQTSVELSDADTLAIGTSDVIGRVKIIDTNRGGQHLAGIVETGAAIFIPDQRNKAIYRMDGQELQMISAIDNDSLFRTVFSDKIPEKNVLGIYDPIRGEYWFVDNQNHLCHVFNNKIGSWVANYEFSGDGKLLGGKFADRKLILLGNVDDQISLYTMYTGDVNQLFGVAVVPRVTFTVNPDPEISKTFDAMMFVATERLRDVDLLVNHEQESVNQEVNGTILDVDMVEGNYRIKTLRDNAGARLRGLQMFVTVRWKDVASTLSSVLTKYRLSPRRPF